MPTCGSCGAPLPEDARFCPACGAAVAEPAAPGEERKLATVLFADLVGSTTLADDEDPERVRALLSRFYDAMSEEIERTGGTIEKFAGDAVMAAFGAPLALEDHAERALHAALAMRRRLAELHPQLALRIGVNTGELVVGRPREGSSFVAGDVVNVSARLEQAAEPGEVLVGERTIGAAGGAFEFGEARDVAAKGKAVPVRGRALLRSLSLMRPRGIGGLRPVFVGRDNELDLLVATYRRVAAQREPHLVTIVGEPGVGKTRLVRELWERLSQEDPAPVRRTGRCLSYGEGITYWPVGEVLKEHLGVRDGDPPERARALLAGREILGLALGLDVEPALHPLEARERLHAAVVRFVDELGAERPAAVLVEDVHSAEDDLLDLLERVLREARAPLLLLTTARPEFHDRRPTWGGGRRNATAIWLEPLEDASAARMLRELLAIEPPPELEQLVATRAEGNPFFVEELVRSLADSGALSRRDGVWEVRELPETSAVPDTVHVLLAARMDRLPPTEKAALQAGAVVGRVFWERAVTHLLGEVEPDLELLEERDFVRRRVDSSLAGETEYAMKHALTREVAYASIPKARRGRLHAAFADWLVENELANDEHASLVAYHCLEAVRPEDADLVWEEELEELERRRADAVRWLRRAADLARRRSEFDDVVDLLSRAEELCEDAHERALIWRDIGLAHALRFDGDAFWAAMQRALEGPLDDDERAGVYGLLAFQTSNRSGMWDVRAVPEIVSGWAEQALALAAPESRARVQALISVANMSPIDHPREAEEAADLAERLGDVELRSYALQIQTSVALEESRFADAAALAERKLELAREIDDPDHLLDVYESVIPVYTTWGRIDDARRLASLHTAASASLSPHHRLHSVAALCEVEDAAGGWEKIVERTTEILATVEANLATPCTRNARSLMVTAVAHEALGRDARKLEERARELSRGGWTAPALASPLIRLAILRRERAELERALVADPFRIFVYGPGVISSRLDAMVALRRNEAIEQLAPTFMHPGLLLEPFVLRALGAARDDDELVERAQERFAALGLEWHAAQTEPLLAGI
jgi:class 3 adenylate cyclase